MVALRVDRRPERGRVPFRVDRREFGGLPLGAYGVFAGSAGFEGRLIARSGEDRECSLCPLSGWSSLGCVGLSVKEAV